MDTKNEAEGETEPNRNETESPWSNLPKVALQRIYSLLRPPQRTNMSLVCKRWSEVFGEPCNWERMKFSFSEPMNWTRGISPVVKFARRYFRAVRHLEIRSSKIPEHHTNDSFEQFLLFVEPFRNEPLLRTVKFTDLFEFTTFLTGEEHEFLVNVIAELLAHQTRLKNIRFVDCGFTDAESQKIYRAVFTEGRSVIENFEMTSTMTLSRPSESLNHLRFTEEFIAPMAEKFLQLLQNLKVDYTLFIEKIFDSVRNIDHRSGLQCSLKRLTVYWIHEQQEKELLGIAAEAWRNLKKLNPEFTVAMAMNFHYSSLLKILLPRGIPLRCLTVTTNSFYDEVSLSTLLKHLLKSEINRSLEDMCIEWFLPSHIAATEIYSFIQSCPRLKKIYICLDHPVTEWQEFFESCLRDGFLGLSSLSMYICDLPDQVHDELASLADRFVPAIRATGLVFAFSLGKKEFDY